MIDTQQMRDRMLALNEEGGQILAAAEAAGNSLSSQQRQRLDAIHDEFNTLEQQVAAADRSRILATPQPLPPGVRDGQVPPSRRASAGHSGSAILAGGAIGQDQRAVKALADFARRGIPFQSSMSIGSDPDGGYLVPVEIDRDMQTVAAGFSPLLPLAKNYFGVTDGFRPVVVSTLPGSTWKAEGDTRSVTASPGLTQIVPQRGGVAAVVQASQWVLQDSDPVAYDVIVRGLGMQNGAAIGAAIISGAAGQPAPKGLTAQTTAATADGSRAFGTVEHIATGGATTAPSLDNCLTALSRLHPFYQAGAAWLMSPSAWAALQGQKSSGGGDFMWQPDLNAKEPPRLFGKPVHIDPNLPAATTAGALSVWLGDWQRAYAVCHYGSPILIRDDVTVKGQVLIYSERRVGGNLVDSAACKAIKTATS
ncbi:MAG: phage major capsid protein [Deltaproteobacteria bacterium]|nr:phage major capsid protein [Deltaproteobacteria bacterium]